VPAAPTALTIVGDRVFAPGADGRLSAYRIDRGLKLKWRFRAVPALGDAVVDERRAYFTLIDNTVRALDLDGGAQRASYPLASRPVGGAILVGATLFVPLADGDVARISVTPGTKPDAAKPAAKTSVRLSAAAASEGPRLRDRHSGERRDHTDGLAHRALGRASWETGRASAAASMAAASLAMPSSIRAGDGAENDRRMNSAPVPSTKNALPLTKITPRACACGITSRLSRPEVNAAQRKKPPRGGVQCRRPGMCLLIADTIVSHLCR
jgi:hypothetical protein